MWFPSLALPRDPPLPRSVRWYCTGIGKSLLALCLLGLPLWWFAHHYRIVYDAIKGANCLPYSVFLVDLGDRKIERDAYVAFVSRQMEPFYANGTPAVKQVIGVPGDRVRVSASGVIVNDAFRGTLLHLEEGEKLWRMGRRIRDVERDERIPEGHLWLMGTAPRSFDSRYWGYIEHEQVIGRAIPLW